MSRGAGAGGRPTFAEEWLVAVLDSLDESVVALDAEGSIVAANPAAERLFDFVVGEWRGRPFADLRWGRRGGDSGGLVDAPVDPVEATLRDRRPRHREVHRLDDDSGATRWVAVSTRCLPTDVPDSPGVVVTAADVTDLVRAEEKLRDQLGMLERLNEELRRAHAMKGDFLAMASDELRTPVASLLGFVEMLESEVGDDERHRLLAAMGSQARQLSRVVGDLLVASRLQGDRLRPAHEEVRVADTVRRTLADFGAVLDAVVLDDELRAVVDRSHLSRIVVCLVENALKHGARPVEIHATRVGTAAELRVCDAGPGVAPEFEPHMFEAFSQGSTGTARAATGVGLGLAIAAGLARANEGEIHYERREPRGSCLVVRLPMPGEG